MATTDEKPEGGGVGELIKTLVYALLIAGVIRTILFQPFWIPSGSMKPTLLIGDFLFVNKFVYGFSAASCPSWGQYNLCWWAKDWEGRFLGWTPARGDVIVFKHPRTGQDYIKRLVGLPGERIQMKGGQLFINGTATVVRADGTFEEVDRPQGPVGNSPRCASRSGGSCFKEQFQEVFPDDDVPHKILNVRDGDRGDDTVEVRVPDGHYFMMGDNRDNSLDSRFNLLNDGVGPVPAADLIGRADRIIFSSAGSSMFYFWTWRSDRFFVSVD